MNHPARLFSTLSTAFAVDPTSELVDRLAAEFTAAVALDLYRHKAPLLLAVIAHEPPEALENLRLYLRGYGLTLVAKPRKGSNTWLVGVRLARPEEEPLAKHAGTVTAHHRVATP